MASIRRNSLGPLAVAMGLSLLLGFGLARGLFATDDLRSQLDLFSQVLYLVQNNYVEAPDNQKLIHGAIDGMLKTLDPHSVYLPPDRAERAAEWCTRIVLSYVCSPSPDVDLFDAASVRRLVGEFIVPGFARSSQGVTS